MKKLLPENQHHLHNEFLLAIVTKCQTLCEPASYSGQVKQKKPNVERIEKNRTVMLVPRKITPLAAVEIKPKTIPRPVLPKSKPLTVNLDVIINYYQLLIYFNYNFNGMVSIFFTESLPTCRSNFYVASCSSSYGDQES